MRIPILHGDEVMAIPGATVAAAAGGAAASVQRAQRVLVGGVIVVVDPASFMNILSRLKDKGVMVIHGVMGLLSKTHVYLIPYQGMVFLAKSKDPLPITPDIEAGEIRLPPI